MYNMTFIGNAYLEAKIIGMCEERGLSWRKDGIRVSVIGIDQHMRDIIEKDSDNFWGW